MTIPAFTSDYEPRTHGHRSSAARGQAPLPVWKPDPACLAGTDELEPRELIALGYSLFIPADHYPTRPPPREAEWSSASVQTLQIEGIPFGFLSIMDTGREHPAEGRFRWFVLHPLNNLTGELTPLAAMRYLFGMLLNTQRKMQWPSGTVLTKPETGMVGEMPFARAYLKEPRPGAGGQPVFEHVLVYATVQGLDIFGFTAACRDDQDGVYKETLAHLEAYILTFHPAP